MAAGHSFARESCSACHVVEAQQQRPPWRIFIGPAFGKIANTRGLTATSLRLFLTTSHPKMPDLILTPEQMADVIAYILSLRSKSDPECYRITADGRSALGCGEPISARWHQHMRAAFAYD